ncbi:BolA family protein [[Haemophilus] ducreyi]|uniref:BolA family protein n=1 Tax=Haemophilus ducreyi TaxID=730 RepID=UPI000654D804|nr:BolA/IbaG family iron-sulfur metabolism protein [[Haemophilus] ducreyi]AKO44882.1 hypothetical protein RZ66_00870 [[Haemophilus] ducreyi]AKO46288.1 hypothetical protein RZ67_00855 [[Haemophilus] ducreyi]AKO47631.1 hypothetical protein RZ68_00865 [[Haemophilus] ducreyi]AKO49012.1 hypothetical protein RZ69_00860 [[Haemophilus] ducreyi]ANF61802.1 hypothetical protein A6037_03090 [[Haemophilus] ducreyi]
MEPTQLAEILRNALPNAVEIHAQGENSHYGVIVVSDELAQLSKVKQQQAVYAPLSEYFATNAIHALTIKVFSTEQWRKERFLNVAS